MDNNHHCKIKIHIINVQLYQDNTEKTHENQVESVYETKLSLTIFLLH